MSKKFNQTEVFIYTNIIEEMKDKLRVKVKSGILIKN